MQYYNPGPHGTKRGGNVGAFPRLWLWDEALDRFFLMPHLSYLAVPVIIRSVNPLPKLDERTLHPLDAAIGMTARSEEFSAAYVAQVCAQDGFQFITHRQDYQAIDGDIVFRETNLRVQLKSTTQEKYWKDNFSFPLYKEWLEKWAVSKIPVILVLVVINSPDGKWANHDNDLLSFPVRGYWTRVDEFAKNNLYMEAQSKVVSLGTEDRVTSHSIRDWHDVAMSAFGGGV